ncbi:unnamed protein product [Rangifer tarandus platyrhynchus]|uniref:Uncharacterized protein n=1 Tax=Rangifer tarandus platyrhynchus TaxID=3082113 RepID=A0ABN8Y6L8_RANTA|nr:unnamed protein product [Rangifer tarandus platyrhynchus]
MHMGAPRLRVGLALCPELPWAGLLLLPEIPQFPVHFFRPQITGTTSNGNLCTCAPKDMHEAVYSTTVCQKQTIGNNPNPRKEKVDFPSHSLDVQWHDGTSAVRKNAESYVRQRGPSQNNVGHKSMLQKDVDSLVAFI